MIAGISGNGWLQIGLYFVALLAVVRPLGDFMAAVYEGRPTFLSRAVDPVERLLYRLAGVHPDKGMRWNEYAVSLLAFNAIGFLAVYGLQRLQGFLPVNPGGMKGVAPHSAFNVAVSFVSNTNWQNYGGETTMSFLTQMLGLTVQNFLSAATGMAVFAALARGLARKETADLGNAWGDVVRGTLHILLPLSVVFAVALVALGVPQTLAPAIHATTLEGQAQTIALGPVASQVAIKQLGTNGGGFFNANSAHPFENPTPLSNFLEALAILLIPAALCRTFGRMVGDLRQGRMLLGVMTVLLAAAVVATTWCEQRGNPALERLGVSQAVSGNGPEGTDAGEARGFGEGRADGADAWIQSGGNLEGKETRNGIAASSVWATATTAASNGSVNAMHDSFTPLGSLVPLLMIQLGEVVFGGVGSGLYGMLLFVIVAVFVAGLMVGRAPEYLGKKIGPFEMKMASLGILIPSAFILIPTAIGVLTAESLGGRANPGPHGFTEILYAFTSQAGNNGSAFAGYGADTALVNLLGGFCLWAGRYWILVAALAVAGSLARKKTVPSSPGTLPTHTPLFAALLMAVILILGALTFVPALALGPIVEQLQMMGGLVP